MYLLPKPKKTEKRQGVYELTWESVITIDENMKEQAGEYGTVYASVLQKGLRESTGLTCAVVKGKRRGNGLFLTVSPKLEPQEYRLQIGEDGIVVEGGDGAAVLYGVQTLCQIAAQCGGLLECMEISDAPDRKNRGYFLDETRGRVLTADMIKTVEEIEAFMASKAE